MPLKDGRVYWFACLSATAPDDRNLAAIKLPQLCKLFSGFHPPVHAVLSATSADQLIWNDIFDVPPLKPYARGRVALLGDAAHAVTPDLGQGACQALEDAAVLSDLLTRYPLDQAFAHFDSQRIPRTQRLVRASRRFGRIAQLGNPLAAGLRNAALRSMPDSVSERWVDSILDVKFEPVCARRTVHYEQSQAREV